MQIALSEKLQILTRLDRQINKRTNINATDTIAAYTESTITPLSSLEQSAIICNITKLRIINISAIIKKSENVFE